MNILVVDDEDLIRKALVRSLQGKGHHLFAAENGVVALDLLQKEKVDLIILDLLMPEKNGFDVLNEMDKKLPVVVISAFSGQQSAHQFNHFHSEEYPQVIGFIKKPFEHLYVTIETIENLYENYIRKV